MEGALDAEDAQPFTFEVAIGRTVYQITNNRDGTFTLVDLDTGVTRTGKFCRAHTPEQHDAMMAAGVYC